MRILITAILLTSALIFVRACSDSSDRDHPYVTEQLRPLGLEMTLDSGIVRGQEHPESEVWEWLAIPFAQPPTGELRWKVPKPIDSWEGVRPATTFGEACPQIWQGAFVGDEDCLHLNIWRPRTQERELPIYVLLHGGSNKRNSNSTSQSQGDRLASHSNVVVVSIQFRLGALGWLYYEPIHTGSPLDDSGNFGLLDIIQALKWIQSNAEAFGGDPGNVIVMGVSSGANNIMNLLLSYESSDLFHKAVIRSTYPRTLSTQQALEQASILEEKLAEVVGINLENASVRKLSNFMRQRSAAELVESGDDLLWGAIADGILIPKQGAALFATGQQVNKVPIIVGTNRDEFKLYTNLWNQFPDLKADVRDGVGRYASDLWRVRGADEFAANITMAPDQPDVYVYRFNWGSPNDEGNSPLPASLGQTVGAFHSAEIPFVLGNWDEFTDPRYTSIFYTQENAEGRKNLSEAIMKYFASFAYSGNPNNENLPVWEPISLRSDFKAIVFDVNTLDGSINISADNEIYTEESIMADIDANLEEPTRSEVIKMVFDPNLFD